jgi:hypothetical protein
MTTMQTEFQTQGRTWTDKLDELMEICQHLAQQRTGFRVVPSTTGWAVSRL